jgi:CRISPR-associated protein Csd2
MTRIANRYEFVYLFDVINGNPNGDPDSGNLPRQDPDTHRGIVTDVCLKRKIRNYVSLVKKDESCHAIYVQDKGVLNNQHKKAYEDLGIKPSAKLPKDPVGQSLTDWMCKQFFDIRAFGAVMGTEVNCGQVRGPVQLAFASSVDPITYMEITITRMAVTNEKIAERERTMGRKNIVPYGLYRLHGFVSANLAERTGFSEEDLELLWNSLTNMFEHDRSAARGEMSARRLIIFKHDSEMGNAPAHKLFSAVTVTRNGQDAESPARCFEHYDVKIDHAAIPKGVEVIEHI